VFLFTSTRITPEKTRAVIRGSIPLVRRSCLAHRFALWVAASAVTFSFLKSRALAPEVLSDSEMAWLRLLRPQHQNPTMPSNHRSMVFSKWFKGRPLLAGLEYDFWFEREVLWQISGLHFF
jgi:hypothetical protein